jgi:phosphoribosylaminoimidazolecarboxamide formyltransferase/IMP cyclohydrolase
MAMRAILSVWDKEGIGELAAGLHALGVELFSTGNTQAAIAAAGVPVRSVSELTGFPEILEGRVKTLHPAVHGGLLARRDRPAHLAELERHGLAPIDLVVSNLYPFVNTVARGVALDDALENIDIGGPTLIRAAAKNFPAVLVVVSPEDYATVLELLRAGDVPLAERRHLAAKAFQHVASYDTAIASYLRGEGEIFPEAFTIALEKISDLRYGENPHQRAAFYAERDVRLAAGRGLAAAVQLHGKELSYNNILDADAAWNAARDFAEPTAVVVKHTNPCGLASHDSLTEAYRRAFAGDPVSAYGGIVAFNRPLDEATAKELAPVFYEIVLAPEYSEAALTVLRKKRDLRILRVQEPANDPPSLDYRRVRGGLLVQTPDALPAAGVEFKPVSKRAPTAAELADLRFAWRAVKHVKSNAIVLIKDRRLVGMGAGQPNRVTSVMLAIRAAGEEARGCVLASDAFFPFPDGPEMALEAGITAIVQPGGSIRDQATIDAVDAAGAAMVFTGVRHFRHKGNGSHPRLHPPSAEEGCPASACCASRRPRRGSASWGRHATLGRVARFQWPRSPCVARRAVRQGAASRRYEPAR